MKKENPHFESILEKVNSLSIPERRKKIDDFLVEIGYLPPKDETNNDWSENGILSTISSQLRYPFLIRSKNLISSTNTSGLKW